VRGEVEAAAARVDRAGRLVIGVAFFATGVAALVLQTTWHRIIALHAGVDLSSATVVVAAFLTGLGIGNLVGGRLADRLTPRRALLALGLAEAGVGGFALLSPTLFYDGYREVAASVDSLPVQLLFNAALVIVPTVLQGMSLPLVARAVATGADRAGSEIGRFNAMNVLGAAAGAALGGWVLVGALGMAGATRFAAGLELSAAALFVGLALAPSRRPGGSLQAFGWSCSLALALWAGWGMRRLIDAAAIDAVHRVGWPVTGTVAVAAGLAGFVAFVRAGSGPPVAAVEEAGAEVSDEVGSVEVPRRRLAIWCGAYALTGAVALGFEQVFFRLVDGVLRANSYTFSHVLTLYLLLLGSGMAAGSWLRPRVRDHARAFLWIQFLVGVTAVGALVVFARVLPRTGLAGSLEAWFRSTGVAAGFQEVAPGDLFLFAVVIPLLLMGLPVFLMGMAFPFVQGLVTSDLGSVGRRTGTLLTANLVGNVVGAVVTSFVLIELVGTAGAYRILAVPLVGAGLVAANRGRRPTVRWASLAGVVAITGVLSTLVPTNHELWAMLHDKPTDAMLVAEDRSCASAIELINDKEAHLSIGAAGQNGYPFDDFHVLIGLLPVLAHDDPEHALAVGFGIGSTSYSFVASPRVDAVTTVELCGGNYELADRLAGPNRPEFEQLRDDPRHERVVGDGRRHLLATDRRYDAIVPDTMRPSSAGAGSLYSREFQELVRSRLSHDGITVGWVPTSRAINAVSSTFPYVATMEVASYFGSELYVAGHRPLPLDRGTLLRRFDALPDDAFSPEQRASLRSFFEDLDPRCVTDGEPLPTERREWENRDLWPRDEYSLSNPFAPPYEVHEDCREAG
jgi:predicted membrane-bound spermidine synthase